MVGIAIKKVAVADTKEQPRPWQQYASYSKTGDRRGSTGLRKLDASANMTLLISAELRPLNASLLRARLTQQSDLGLLVQSLNCT